MTENIESLLNSGKTKKQIWQQLKGSADNRLLAQELNNLSYPALRKQYMYLNLFLAAALIFLTFTKIMAALTFGLNLSFIIFMIVPLINMFLLQKIMRFKRIGYQFLFILSCISLVHQENHNFQALALLAIIIGLSGLLYLKMFPKGEIIDIKLATQKTD